MVEDRKSNSTVSTAARVSSPSTLASVTKENKPIPSEVMNESIRVWNLAFRVDFHRTRGSGSRLHRLHRSLHRVDKHVSKTNVSMQDFLLLDHISKHFRTAVRTERHHHHPVIIYSPSSRSYIASRKALIDSHEVRLKPTVFSTNRFRQV